VYSSQQQAGKNILDAMICVIRETHPFTFAEKCVIITKCGYPFSALSENAVLKMVFERYISLRHLQWWNRCVNSFMLRQTAFVGVLLVW
jgi:hypothetical protein